LTWEEVPGCHPEKFTLNTVRERFAEIGDPWLGIDLAGAAGSLEPLLGLARELGPAEKPPKSSGRRQSTMPLIEIARAKTKEEALAGLDRWKARHSDVTALLQPADILVDGMRGRSSIWYRIRVNLQHVPEDARPEQEPLESDYNPWANAPWARDDT
jgi:bifunctional non-homologous end joining protein LigD